MPAAPLQASRVESSAATADVTLETPQMRCYHEQWLQRTGK
ncbi:MAG: hypothetical protein ACYDCQ_02805 [Dehalococcoidia bacterium]